MSFLTYMGGCEGEKKGILKQMVWECTLPLLFFIGGEPLPQTIKNLLQFNKKGIQKFSKSNSGIKHISLADGKLKILKYFSLFIH